MKSKPGMKDADGALQIDGKELIVVDLDTGAPVEHAAMVWGPGSIMMAPLEGEDGGILEEGHLDPDKNYLILAIPCDEAENV